MGRARITLLGVLTALSMTLATAPLAQASAFDKIFQSYQQTGKVDACAFSESALQQAKNEVPNDIEAYAPDFPNALQTALEKRTAGGCQSAAGAAASGGAASGGAAGASSTPGAGGTGTPAAPAGPAPAGSTVTPGPGPDATASPAVADEAIARSAKLARDSSAGLPAPVVALGVLGALLALGGLAYGLTQWLAWDPRWGRSARHALGEAGWRAGNTWSEFADWVRLGR